MFIFTACGKEQESGSKVQGNSLPPKRIELTNLDNFKSSAVGKWSVAGNVFADRLKNHHLEAKAGTGILVNLPGEDVSKGEHLFSNFEHGDIDLELEFMMPKGSNSGIYLQGRYEVQLFDSWLKDSLSYSDAGGIYRGAGEAFKGNAPDRNASKAPGLWQQLKIRFRAPKFDGSGKKIANARFEEVYLNGVLIHNGIEVSEPTLAAAFEDEKARGPLMLQGDHGPVAFRNISYKAYTGERIALKEMRYEIYDGMYKIDIDSLPEMQATITGTTDTLSGKFSHEDDLFVIEGAMEAPRSGEYMFELMAGGPAWLYINAQQVTDNRGTRDYEDGHYGVVKLKEGENKFRIIYQNYDESLALAYEGPGIPWTALNTPNSARHWPKAGRMIYEAKNAPVLQRGFMMHKGKKNTSAVTVGLPVGLNYAYDHNNNSPLNAWYGTFLDIGEMWIERGESQLAKPYGAAVEFSGKPTVAILENPGSLWPATDRQEVYSEQGYRLNENGLPVFYYQLNNISIEDYLYPSDEYFSNINGASALVRNIRLRLNQTEEKVYLLLGSGSSIELLPNGVYALDDKSYYIENLDAGEAKPFIRQSGGEAELILPVVSGENGSASVSYSIIW